MIFKFNVIFISSCVSLISADYSYSNADEWENENPQCGGSQQSPINISSDMVNQSDLNAKTTVIEFKNIYDTVAERMILENDGHRLKLCFEWPNDEKSVPYAHGGPLDGEFITHSFQFRWGSDVYSGSGHHFDNMSFPMEVQIVHYNKEFNSYEEAESSKNGLNISEESDDFLTKIIEKIPEVSEPGNKTDIEPFALGDFFDRDEAIGYLVYPGSLPYPPCYETVTWLISNKVVPVTEEQIKAFKKLNLVNNDDHNIRPLQPTNGRKVQVAMNSNAFEQVMASSNSDNIFNP